MARTTDPNAPIFYVYVIFRLDGIPCYVGKGVGDRWRVSLRGNGGNPRLRYLLRKHGPLPIAIAREGLAEAEAFATEIAFIRAIGRVDLGTGPLLNHTDGGDGTSNPSPSTRAKMRAAKAGKKQTPEFIEKRTAPNRGKPKPEGFAEKIRQQRIAKFADPVRGAAHKAALTGRPITDGINIRKLKPGESVPDGWRHGWPDHVRAKTSATLKASGFTPPSSKGKTWITNGIDETTIQPDARIPEGWYEGRVGHTEETRKTMSDSHRGMTWFCTPAGQSYQAREKRAAEDIEGRKLSDAPSRSWWHTPEGVSYVAFEPRSEQDSKGRK